MADDSNNLAIYDFKLEAKNIISELDALYKRRERQIGLIFSKLFDNLPREIRDTPVNECLEAYLNFVKSEESYIKLLNAEKKTNEPAPQSAQEQKKGELDKKENEKVVSSHDKEVSIVTIIDDSVIADDEDGKENKLRPSIKQIDDTVSKIEFENFSKFNNLTSTVKKSNPIKSSNKILSDKIDSMLIEEMIIPKEDLEEQTYYNSEDVGPEVQTKILAKSNLNEMTITTNVTTHTDYLLKLVYYLKDGSEARVNLKDLKGIDMDQVHSGCLNELKMAIANNS